KEGSCKGIIENPLIVGNSKTEVDRIEFHIPNLRSIWGTPVKTDDKIMANIRLQLGNGVYSVILDKVDDYEERRKKLQSVGGYSFLYHGVLTRVNKQTMNFEESSNVMNSLSNLLHLINGTRCAPLLRTGLLGDTMVYVDF